MAWLGLDKLFLGVSLDEEAKRSADLDAQINAANQQLEDRGYVAPGYAAAAAADLAAGNATTGAGNPVEAVDADFQAGLKEGVNNVLDAPGKVVGAVSDATGQLGWGILKNIPLWLWVVGAIALFVYLGGLSLLAGIARGKIAKAAASSAA
jgi:hypothetical protein